MLNVYNIPCVLYEHFSNDFHPNDNFRESIYSSEIKALHSKKCFSETPQNLPFIRIPTLCSFFFFILCNLLFLAYEYPGLCRHILVNSLGKKCKIAQNENEETT